MGTVLGPRGVVLKNSEVDAAEATTADHVGFVARPSAKSFDRIWEKAREEFDEVNEALQDFEVEGALTKLPFEVERALTLPAGWVCDINGVTIVFHDVPQMRKCFEAIQTATWDDDGIQLLRVKNGFHNKSKAV